MMQSRHNRFINNVLPESQDKKYNPIIDYDESPAQSLEGTVKNLIPLVPGVLGYVSSANANCKRDSNLLTQDESAAIYLYTMSTPFVSSLNMALRSDNRRVREPWFAFLKLLNTALIKLPSTKTTVWRGINNDATLQFIDNDVYTWWGITSCSVDINSVRPFLGQSGTLFTIETIHGKDISEFSAIFDEREVILLSGTRVRAKSSSLNLMDQFFIIHLEEVTSPRLVYDLVNVNLSTKCLNYKS